MPVGALADVSGEEIESQTVISTPDGKRLLRLDGKHSDPDSLGEGLAQEALAQGAGEMLL